ncbi:MAG: response regulator receiver protein [Verrucomicrobiales bacterium]|nr:response regulator receiver protein [Verrucomicrobiales bacterium]
MDAIRPIVLHAEDDPNDIALMKHACLAAKTSFQLQPATDGEKAIHYLSGVGIFGNRNLYPPASLVLLDLKMPRRGGFEVLQWIRNNPVLKCLPVVILTSSRHDVDVRRAYELGANSYLVKPVNFEALVNMARVVDLYWMTLVEKPAPEPQLSMAY